MGNQANACEEAYSGPTPNYDFSGQGPKDNPCVRKYQDEMRFNHIKSIFGSGDPMSDQLQASENYWRCKQADDQSIFQYDGMENDLQETGP